MDTNMRVVFVEKRLNIKLPKQYAKFLEEFGDFEGDGFEIYGYSEEYLEPDKIPCVIGATKLYRDDYKLSADELVIAHSGYEDYVFTLDSVSGHVYEINMRGDKKKVADDFDTWLKDVSNQ